MTMPLLMTVSWSVVSWSVLGLKGWSRCKMNFLRRMQASDDDGLTSYAYRVLDSPTVLNHNDHIELKWGELVAEEIMSYEL